MRVETKNRTVKSFSLVQPGEVFIREGVPLMKVRYVADGSCGVVNLKTGETYWEGDMFYPHGNTDVVVDENAAIVIGAAA